MAFPANVEVDDITGEITKELEDPDLLQNRPPFQRALVISGTLPRLCFTPPYPALPLLYYADFCSILPYCALLSLILCYPTLPYSVLFCSILPYPPLSGNTLFCPILLYLIPSHSALSYPIPLCSILSYPKLLCPVLL